MQVTLGIVPHRQRHCNSTLLCACKGSCKPQCALCGDPAELNVQGQVPLINVRLHPQPAHMCIGNRLQPDRLPNSCDSGVPASPVLIVCRLLAPRLGCLRLINYFDNEFVPVLAQKIGDIQAKGHITAAMAADKIAVHPHKSFVVNSSKMQEDALSLPVLRHLKHAPVPYHWGCAKCIAYTAELGLKCKGHPDFLIKGNLPWRFLIVIIKAKIPNPVQGLPTTANEIWTRILCTQYLHQKHL